MWNTGDVFNTEENEAVLRVNGAETFVNAGDNLRETVLNAAREAGYQKFHLFINDEEVLPSNAPDTVEDGMVIEIRPYDVAG